MHVVVVHFFSVSSCGVTAGSKEGNGGCWKNQRDTIRGEACRGRTFGVCHQAGTNMDNTMLMYFFSHRLPRLFLLSTFIPIL